MLLQWKPKHALLTAYLWAHNIFICIYNIYPHIPKFADVAELVQVLLSLSDARQEES